MAVDAAIFQDILWRASGALARNSRRTMPELRFQIPDDLDAKIEAAMPEYLDRKGFLCLLIDQALDSPVTLGGPSAAGTPSSSKAVSSRKRVNTYIEDIGPFLDERLLPHKELIAAWWDIRRQIHGKKAPGTEQAWNGSQNALLAILRNHGPSVLKATIEAAVAAGWRGIRESYAAVPAKGNASAQAEHNHPAYRDASEVLAEQERLAQQNIEHLRLKREEEQTAGGVLEGLF